MKIVFEDFASKPQPSQTFEDESELASFLEQQRNESMMCELISESGFKLQIGIDGDIGCAQFLSTSDEPPYLVALTPIEIIKGSHDFDMTGSATEVLSKNCLPFELLKKIVLDFFKTGQKSNLVEWEDA